MSPEGIYGWDDTNKIWVKVLVNAAGKLIIDPSEIFEDPPTDGEAGKAATSNWSHDHNADPDAHHAAFTAADHTAIGDAAPHHAEAHTLASHTTKAHSELTGVGSSDHHVRYADSEALAAAVQAGAITDGVTKAPTHDAVYDVKTTADGAIAKSLLTTRGDIIYRDASAPARLAKGASGTVLTMGADDPAWAAPAGGGATKQFFVSVFSGAGGLIAGYVYSVYRLSVVTTYAEFSFRLPADFTSLTSVKVILFGTTTGTFGWTASTRFGANGEAFNNHTGSATAGGQAVTNLQLLELNISAAFAGVAANDIIGLRFTLDTLTTTVNINLIGLDVKYA